jgi:hypothetical protein
MIKIQIDGHNVHTMPARANDRANEQMAMDYIRSLGVSVCGMTWYVDNQTK